MVIVWSRFDSMISCLVDGVMDGSDGPPACGHYDSGTGQIPKTGGPSVYPRVRGVAVPHRVNPCLKSHFGGWPPIDTFDISLRQSCW